MTNYPELVIKDFHQGMASSAYVQDGAVTKSVALDVFNYPGIARLNKKATAVTNNGTAFAALPKWFAKDPLTGRIACLDANGKVRQSDDGGVTWADTSYTPSAGTHGNGFCWWKTYWVVVTDSNIDLIATANSPVGSQTGWKSIYNHPNHDHPCLVSKNDGFLYIGNCTNDATTNKANTLGCLQEVTGQTFDPTNTATYTWTPSALILPANFHIRCLEEIRGDILIGTYQGTNIYDNKIATIFPWDRTQGYLSFNFPVNVEEAGIQAMKNINDTIYVMAGILGKMYQFTDSGLVYLGRIPFDTVGADYIQVFPGAMCEYNGRPMVGVSYGNNSSSSTYTNGVFSFNGKSFACEFINSGGNETQLQVGALFSSSQYGILIGWQFNGTTYGIDYIDTSNNYAAFVGYFESLLYQLGNKFEPFNIAFIEAIFAKPLASGGGIKVKYRTDASSSYSTLVTLDYTTYGAVTSIVAPYNIKGIENIQFRVEFEGAAELLSLIVKPMVIQRIPQYAIT